MRSIGPKGSSRPKTAEDRLRWAEDRSKPSRVNCWILRPGRDVRSLRKTWKNRKTLVFSDIVMCFWRDRRGIKRFNGFSTCLLNFEASLDGLAGPS